MTDSWQPDRKQNAESFPPTEGRIREKAINAKRWYASARVATSGRSCDATRLECVDAGGQARQLPRHSILVEHTLSDRPVQFGLRQLKRRSGRLLVTAIDRRLDPLHESAHTAHPGPVDRRAFGDLSYALFRRFVTGHARSR